MPSADSLIIFVWCFTIQLHHIHHPAIPSYCSPSLRNLLHAILLLPFPPSCTFISFSYLPPNALPVLPKDCIFNFYLADQSNTSRLPLKKLFAFSLLLYLFPFFSPSLTFCFFYLVSFQYFPSTFCFSCLQLLFHAPPGRPCGRVRWGEAGRGRLTGWNLLVKLGELSNAFVQGGERESVCVCVCVLKFGTSSQSYVSKVAPSVAVIFRSVCCHFLSCPYQPSLFLFVSDRSLIVFYFFYFYLRSFPVLRQWFVTTS